MNRSLVSLATAAFIACLTGAQAACAQMSARPCQPCLASSETGREDGALDKHSIDALRLELAAREAARNLKRPGATLGAPPRKERDLPRQDPALARFSTADILSRLIAKEKAVYGIDDRHDIFKLPAFVRDRDRVLANASATAAMVMKSNLEQQPDKSYRMHGRKYGESYLLCPSERFVNQPACAHCSGFLVAPDIVVTAGHCVGEDIQLASFKVVFDYRMEDAEHAREAYPESSVYEAVEILGRQLGPGDQDWAVVRLDRPVTGRAPVKVSSRKRIGDSDSVYVIGHPSGLPQKYAGSAEVRDNSRNEYFVASLDTYGGNSGSPVFNARTHEVEGILVRGEQDFRWTDKDCVVSMPCPLSGCRGEDVTRASEFLPVLTKGKSAN